MGSPRQRRPPAVRSARLHALEPVEVSAGVELGALDLIADIGGDRLGAGEGAVDGDHIGPTCYASRMTFWSALETYQTIVTGFVGFGGVIATIWLNAKFARNQRRDERDHERESLRVALLAELDINGHTLRENADVLKLDRSDPNEPVFVPTDRIDDVYQAFIPRIGLLSEDEVGRVMKAYLSLKTYNAKLFLPELSEHAGPRHVKVSVNDTPLLAGMIEGVLFPVDEAIKALRTARKHE